jgi:hypothetical protein
MSFCAWNMGDTIIPDRILGLSGVTGTAQAGTVGAQNNSNFTSNLTAVTGTGSVGSVGAFSNTVALSGISATGSAGNLSPVISAVASGVSGTGSVGTVAIGFTPVVRTFTASGAGSDVSPAGCSSVKVEGWGPGGGGAKDSVGNTASAGSSGAYFEHNIAISPGVTINFFIGTGGAAQATDVTPGNAGSAATTCSTYTLSAGAGFGGILAGTPSTPTASGGNVQNQPGVASSGFSGPGAFNGGGSSGINNQGTVPGGGGGTSSTGNGRSGGQGQITLTYS